MIASAVQRLRQLPPVFTLADLCCAQHVVPSIGSVMLHRWRTQKLVRPLAQKAGVYFNMIVAPDWQAQLPVALAKAVPSAMEVGETILLQAGWTTQRPTKTAYAVVDTAPRVAVVDALLVERPASWYVSVHRGNGLADRSGMPTLVPAWALADCLVFGGDELWTPAPDDLYADDEDSHAFVEAYNALVCITDNDQVALLTAADTLHDAYEIGYASAAAHRQTCHRACMAR